MKFLEKDLEDYIFKSSSKSLEDCGLYFIGKKYRKLRIGSYGISDLIYFRRPFYNPYEQIFCKGEITVMELKKDKISVSSFFQAVRYVRGIQRYIEMHRPNLDGKINYNIVLIGSDVNEDSDIRYLTSIFPSFDFSEISTDVKTSVSLFTYELIDDFIVFSEASSLKMNNEKF